MSDDPTYVAEVLAVARLSPSLVRVELGGTGLRPFVLLGVPDEACYFSFPIPGVPGDPDPFLGRWYTVRRFDANRHRMTVDFITHAGGIGAGWARGATVGDRLLISRQNSWYKRPADARWQFLLGDLAALPAIGRIIEDCPADLRTIAVIMVPDLQDEQSFAGQAEITWVHEPRPMLGSMLTDRVRAVALPDDGPGYVYVAGEAAATRDVRKYLRHELRLPSGSYGVVGYWRINAEKHRHKLRASSINLQQLWSEIQVNSSDEQEALDRYERKLDQFGLL